jgi:hypothetical protein
MDRKKNKKKREITVEKCKKIVKRMEKWKKRLKIKKS